MSQEDQLQPTLLGSQPAPGKAGHFGAAGPLVDVGLPQAMPTTSALTRDHDGQVPIARRSEQPGRRSPSGDKRSLSAARWPLWVVLAVQGALSLRLIWSDTAFQDEALYLRAGHLEWAHWLHQAPIPNFPAYFSGTPVIYPPLGALADSIGGLAGARILSLLFMLGVTSLLCATTSRLYGRRAALLAAGLFATLAGTQFLGSFATFDAMALFLLALATWLGVRSADCRFPTRTALLVTAGVTLAVADAVKYATALFTPVVLIVVAVAVWRQHGGAAWLTALVTMLCSWFVPVFAAILAGGGEYWLGITTSTLSRPQSNAPVATVLRSAYVWTSLIVVLAVLGAVLAGRSKSRGKFLPALLAATALLVPAEQARIHTTVSLQKHVVFGAWFAAIAAGYAMARLSRVDPGRGWAAVMAIPIVASTLFGSMGQAAALHNVWPNVAGVVNALHSAIRAHPGEYLAEDYDVEAYYLRAEVPWQRWSSTYYFSYQGISPGASSYTTAIDDHYFSLVILDFGDTLTTDTQITADMRHAGGYYVLTRTGRFTIWASRTRASNPQSGGNLDRY
jgi:Dolichyl-phosphate-mannose-protein mannosyltransferase